MISFVDLKKVNSQFRDELVQAATEVIDSGWFIMGNEVEKFETSYAKYCDSKYCIGVSNGLDALFLSLKALGIKTGDEVIIPSNTYIATALAVSYTGATPIFVEPDIHTYNINPERIIAAISPHTKAIIPVHLYGQACDMESVMDIATKNNIYVIEDNAQAHGATFKNKITGSWGHVNGTSFYPGKNLGALGDGGAITTNDGELAKKIQSLHNYGSTIKYKHDVIGYNMRLDEMQAAMLSVKLKYMQSMTAQRQKVAQIYNEQLKGIGDIIIPVVSDDATHSYHLYVIRTKHRDALQKHLTQNDIGTLIHYPIPPHLQIAYSALGYKQGDYPIAEELANSSLSLPLWPGISEEEIAIVVNNITSFYAGQ